MRKLSRRTWMLAVALVLAAVPLSGAAAHPRPVPRHRAVVHRARPADPERAAALRARATALRTDRAHFREAAGLLERASALTPVEDSARAHDLYVAGNLRFYTGALAGAQMDMAQSADAALERGDVEAAVDALVSAAWLAAKRDEAEDARAYAVRALHLSASPLLSPSVRDRIRERVVVSPPETVSSAGRTRAAGRTGFSVASERSAVGRVRPPLRRRPAPVDANPARL